MFYYLNDVTFGRGKDRQKRKRRGLGIANKVGLGALTAGGIGLVVLASKKKFKPNLPNKTNLNNVSYTPSEPKPLSEIKNTPLDNKVKQSIQDEVDNFKKGFDEIEKNKLKELSKSKKEYNKERIMKRREYLREELDDLKKAKEGINSEERFYKSYKGDKNHPEYYEKFKRNYKDTRKAIKAGIKHKRKLAGYGFLNRDLFSNNIKLITFGRGKDKKKRKRPSIKQGFITGGNIGAGIGAGMGLLRTGTIIAASPKGYRKKALGLGLLGTTANTANKAVLGSLIGGGINYIRRKEYDRNN